MNFKNLMNKTAGILAVLALMTAAMGSMAFAGETNNQVAEQAPAKIQLSTENQVSPDDVAKKSLNCWYEYQQVCNAYGYCVWQYVYICM
jgi:hypothetical protein